MSQTIDARYSAFNSAGSPQNVRTRNADRLTGLRMMASFQRRAKELIETTDCSDDALCFVYFNIENMKLYNERFGMAAGDDLLTHAARTISETFVDSLLGRVGDDRFILLTRESELEEGIARVYEQVRDFNAGLRTVIRVGVFAHDGKADVALSCDRAKLACDHIKGRYDVYWYRYDERLSELRNRRQFILDRFERAKSEHHIQVYFQPIFRVIGQRVAAFEALARWIDPEEGFISPGDFIPVLEDARLVHELDLFVIEEVCRMYSNVIDMGLPMAPANVNLSRLDMELCDIVAETHALMQRYGVPAHTLNIEITESAFEQSNELLGNAIEQFHALGVQVWMDDFGSGYSSLNVLRDYPFDVVKLDMSFLRDTSDASREKTKQMLPHLITMMKDMGFQTLAEGVETKEQVDFLRKAGCEKVQGYYYAKPCPIEEFAPYITSGKYEVESDSQRVYMDRVGHVDLNAPAAVDRDVAKDIEFASSIPAAIVEFSGNTVRYLAWNSSYLVYLRDIGMETIENSTKQMNDLTRPQSQGFFGAAAKMRGKAEWVNLAFYEGEDLCTGRARCIALDEEADTCAFVYLAFNVSRYLAQAGYELPK